MARAFTGTQPIVKASNKMKSQVIYCLPSDLQSTYAVTYRKQGNKYQDVG
jgi:hypothetical protein